MPLAESFTKDAVIGRISGGEEDCVFFSAMALQLAPPTPLDNKGGLISTLEHVFENRLFQLTSP